MTIRACRVCGGAFLDGALLHYENMPAAAQNFPDAAALAADTASALTVSQGSRCGLGQLGNDPVPYHKEVIRAAAVSSVLRDLKGRQFADFIAQYSLRGKRIVEIGCGRGEFLSLLNGLGADAYGLEYSAPAAEQCVKDGLKVVRGYPGEGAGALENGPFDAFLLLMFL